MKTKPITFLLSLSFLFFFSSFVYGGEPEVNRDYYDNGKLKSETHYKNGKKEGLQTGWFESGSKKAEAHFKNGRLHGTTKAWYKNGLNFFILHNKNGIESGIRKEWDENGKLIFEGKPEDMKDKKTNTSKELKNYLK